MRRSGGDELVALRLLLRGRERIGGPGGALLAEDEAQLLRRPQPLGVVRTEGRARLVEVQGAEQIAMEEARLARHLAALRHVAVSTSVRVGGAAWNHPRARSSPGDPANGGEFVTYR